MIEIPLPSGYKTYVDDEFGFIKDLGLGIYKENNNIHVVLIHPISRKTLLLSKYVLGIHNKHSIRIKYRDNNTLNNQVSNLIIVKKSDI